MPYPGLWRRRRSSWAHLGAILRVVKLLLLSAKELARALPMSAAIDAAARAYLAASNGEARAPLRTAIPAGEGGTTLLMGAAIGEEELAAKIVSFFPSNAQEGAPTVSGLVIAMDPQTGAPRALMPGGALTATRTGAASGIATKVLAREHARVGAVLGAGVQARTQALAIDTARELEEIRVWARRPEAGEALVGALAGELRAKPVFVEDVRDAVADAEVICTATSAQEPLLSREMLAPGTHVNAVGSFRPEMKEFDAGLISAASVFVDSVEACLEESGELIAAVSDGVTSATDWTELGDVLEGRGAGRASDEELTLFKSVGLAPQDACAASAALAAAEAQGIGQVVDLS